MTHDREERRTGVMSKMEWKNSLKRLAFSIGEVAETDPRETESVILYNWKNS